MAHTTISTRVAAETALHSIQKKITEKIELITNFASIKNQIRYLVNQLDFYDRPNHPGLIAYEDFLHYFVRRLNFMGLNKELEFVFFHYDDQMTGFLDYRYFAQQLYGQFTPSYPILSKEATESLERIRVQVLGPEEDPLRILRFKKRLTEIQEQDKDGFILANTFAEKLSMMLDKDMKTFYWRREITNLLEFFDVLHDGKNVHIPTFSRYIMSPFSIYRKQLVRAVYDMLGSKHPGFPTVEDVKACYVESKVIEFRGKSFQQTSLSQLIEYLTNQATKVNDYDAISWASFLNYYQCVSMIVEKEEHFEYIVRRSWSIPYAPSGEEFFMVTENFQVTPEKSGKGGGSVKSTATNATTPRTVALSAASAESADDFDNRSLASRSFTEGGGGSRTSSPASSSRKSPSAARSPSKAIYRRVIVVHSDQTEECVQIYDELGKTKLDIESVQKELVNLGVQDIQNIKM